MRYLKFVKRAIRSLFAWMTGMMRTPAGLIQQVMITLTMVLSLADVAVRLLKRLNRLSTFTTSSKATGQTTTNNSKPRS